MPALNTNVARGIALVLQGENLKASAFVTHSGSLGTLRERMVQRFVREATPGRFRVETGLISDGTTTSRQCDILVHESDIHAPLYRCEDFVVVRSDTARAVVEVKSNLDQQGYKDLTAVHNSVMAIELRSGFKKMFIPTFGYALDGVTFNSFIEYAKEAASKNPLREVNEAASPHLNWPVCIAVREQRYLGFRPLSYSANQAPYFVAIDFSKASDPSDIGLVGIETGYFLQLYESVLRDRRNSMAAGDLASWVRSLPISDDGKVWITDKGETHSGDVPVDPSPANDRAPPAAARHPSSRA